MAGSGDEGADLAEIERLYHQMRALLSGPRGSGPPRPPFDACYLRGTYGRRGNDWRGTHDAVEVALTPLGERFFLEQAAARDLSLFVRSPAMRAIRDRIRRGEPVPPAEQIAARYPRASLPSQRGVRCSHRAGSASGAIESS